MDKKLISRTEISSSRYSTCGGNVNNANPGTKDELNNQINACNNTDVQAKRCEFYCPQGRHPEGNNLSNRKCVQNSVRKGITITSMTVYGGITVTYDPDCVDAGQETTTVVTKEITGGKRTFTLKTRGKTGSEAGTREILSETVSLECYKNQGYWEWENGAEKDHQCLPTSWVQTQPPTCYPPSSTTNTSCSSPSGCGTYGTCTTTCSVNTNTTYGQVYCQASNGTQFTDDYCPTNIR